MRLRSIVGAAALAAAFTSAAQPVRAQNVVVNSIKFDSVVQDPVTGVVTGTGGLLKGTIGGLPFQTAIDTFQLTPLQNNGRRCSVLHLALAPIDLELLGLFVNTSAICLDITAFQGQGLLGDLLCGLAGGNLPLVNSADLTNGLSQILTTALGRARNTPPGRAGTSVCQGDCEILDLILGPLTLNLLGVQVRLDNCNNGPVEVCVSATAADGLLGQLLCGLADGGLLSGLNLNDILALVQRLLAGLQL